MTADEPEPTDPDPAVGGYPHGWDCAWLAVDEVGQVAVFTTSGQAPVPVAVLDPPEVLERSEALVWDLPVRGDFVSHATYPVPPAASGWFFRPPPLPKDPGPGCCAEFAQRGLFAYDWLDAHRFRPGEMSGTYELLTSPTAPVVADDLPPAVAGLARLVRLPGVRFDRFSSVAVAQRVPCLWGRDHGSPGYGT